MTERTLSNRELNRTHLHRQHLLERTSMSTGDMLLHLVGLQAQEVRDPYLGLWNRIEGFQHDDLAAMLPDRSAVRASLMRGTIHLVTAEDYLELVRFTWKLHQRAVHSVSSARLVPREHHAEICAMARELLADQPMSAADIGTALQPHFPEYEARSLGQVVRFLLPLIQVPPRGLWEAGRSPKPVWTTPQGWLNTEVIEEEAPPHAVIRRYLRAFGPASLPDISSWSGVTNFKKPLTEMADELVTYKDEEGVVLYDLAGLEVMSPDMEAPVRFMPMFDNALLGHKNRRRIVGDEERALLATQNGMPASAFLVDGFVAGMWNAKDGQIQLAEFRPLSKSERQAIEDEAAKMSVFWTGAETPLAWVPIWKEPGKW